MANGTGLASAPVILALAPVILALATVVLALAPVVLALAPVILALALVMLKSDKKTKLLFWIHSETSSKTLQITPCLCFNIIGLSATKNKSFPDADRSQQQLKMSFPGKNVSSIHFWTDRIDKAYNLKDCQLSAVLLLRSVTH